MKQKTITTREFLRNFKKFKELLLGGDVMHIFINVGGDEELRIERHHKGLTGKEFVRRIRALNKPIHIERPTDLFDDFLERARSRRNGRKN